ncbi:MAG: hypothetical protein ACXVDJ_05670 [Tumebacillaceae bacterium]
MSDNVNTENAAETPNGTGTASGKSGASKYIIPALGGAIVWVGLLGFGLNKIYSMGSDHAETKPTEKTVSSAPVTYAVPNEKAPAEEGQENSIEASSRFAIDMQDVQGKDYTIYLKADKETPSTQAAPGTIGAAAGDMLFHGDYDTYVSPAGSSDYTKQAVRLPNTTFNLNRKQVYVLKGNPQLLVVTQPNSANGVTARYFSLIGGVLTPVDLVQGANRKTQLFMMAMKANPSERSFVSVEYNTSNGHWHFTTWKADPNNKVLRAVSESDMTGEQAKASNNNGWALPTPGNGSGSHSSGRTTPSHSQPGGNGNNGASNGPSGPVSPTNNGGNSGNNGGTSNNGGNNSTGGDIYGGGYDNIGGDLYNGSGNSTGDDLYGGYDTGGGSGFTNPGGAGSATYN